MRQGRRLAIAAVMAALTVRVSLPAGAQSPHGPAAGVLIGLHLPSDGDARPPTAGRLRALWVSILDRQQVSEPLELPNLLVPRKSGFWRMGLHAECAEEQMTAVDDAVLGTGVTIADHLWAAPVGQKPEVRLARDGYLRFHSAPCVGREVYCVNDWTTRIYWVWPEYASLEMGSRGDCGAHSGWSPGYTVRRLHDLGTAVTVGDALGKSAEDTFHKKFKAAEKNDERCLDDKAAFEPGSWYIERVAGTWTATGWSSTHRLCGYGIDYAVDVDLSAVTGRRNDNARQPQLTTRFPALTDAHVAPGGEWALVVTETELILVDAASTDGTAIRVSKAADENVVMVEWATGSHVARWNDEIVRLRQTKEPTPRLVQ